jgi:hypothetical protein
MNDAHAHKWEETATVGSRMCLVCGMVVTFDHRSTIEPTDRQRLLGFLNNWRSRLLQTTSRDVLYADPSSEAFGMLVTLNTVIDYVDHM